MITLRNYQKEAVSKMLWSLNIEGGSLVVIVQAGGKSHIIAEFARQYAKPVLILCPTKEILEQNYEKLANVVNKKDIGLYSASVGLKEVKTFTLATIQSAYKHPEEFLHFEVILCDEADLWPLKSETSMHNKLLRYIPKCKVIGLTGTPFRMGIIYRRWGRASWMLDALTVTQMINRQWKGLWRQILTVINYEDLAKEGYVAPLEYIDVSLIDHEQIKPNKSKSEFNLEDFEQKVCNSYTSIANYIRKLPHKSCIVYCSSIEQAETLQKEIKSSQIITSTSKKKDREKAIEELKTGKIKFIFNVMVLTLGFNFPELEAIVLLRPTKSLRLYAQILGRVARTSPTKKRGYVYDFVSNVKNLGKLEEIKIAKDQNNKWNVFTNKFPNGAHNIPLFTYRLKP